MKLVIEEGVHPLLRVGADQGGGQGADPGASPGADLCQVWTGMVKQ